MDFVRNNRMLSLLGQGGTFGTALYEFATDDDRIMAVSADLIRVSGLEHFYEEHPKRCINVGIAEQNAVGFAAGLADAGKIPFVTTFSNFATMRANEFVRHFMSYMQCNVKLVGLGSGFAMELFGNTHYGLEDIAVLRSCPNITILSPADCLEVTKCVEYAINHTGPIYIRLSGKINNPVVNRKDYQFEVGKGNVLRDGENAVIISTGSMVAVAMKAAKKLEVEGITVKVINMHTIKPIDAELIQQSKDYPLILTIEEHSKIGGLGSAVAEVLVAEESHGRHITMGTCDTYLSAGSYSYMLNQHGLTVDGIIKNIKENVR